MKERIFKNYATTALGMIMILAAAYVAIVNKDNSTATLIGGYGLIFLRSKDSLIGLEK